MKALLKSDLITLKQSAAVILAMAVGVSAILMIMDASAGIISYLVIFLQMQATTTIVAERMSGWGLYKTTFPVSRKTAVFEKYILSILGGICGFGVGALFCLVSGIPLNESSILIGIVLSLSEVAFGIVLLYLLPKNAFMIGVLLGMVPGAVGVGLWIQKISQPASMMSGDMHSDFLWMCIGILAACTVVSAIAVPWYLSKRDQ